MLSEGASILDVFSVHVLLVACGRASEEYMIRNTSSFYVANAVFDESNKGCT